jgi:hypothetical protein
MDKEKPKFNKIGIILVQNKMKILEINQMSDKDFKRLCDKAIKCE